ncbi:MAG: hypothetical protein PHR35_14980 [Kiritimatiellae bacterium]|nr:hypothetical protein [Kiritimatiellia bacterium]
MQNKRFRQWWRNGFFGLHYDLHASKDDTRLGAELTPAHLREQLLKVRPDFVQCDCKGHPGYASYPTKVGTPAPGIVQDALRIHRDVTRELGIPLSVHYSGIWDSRAIELHPQWAAVDRDGKRINPRPPQSSAGIVCPRGPYLEQLMIPQMLEIIDEYDVDGFWVDGDNWAVRDCYCPRCRAEFAKRTGIAKPPVSSAHPDWPAWRAFQRDSFVEYVTRYTQAVHRRKPECAVCSNWMYTMRQPGTVTAPVDYISGDFTASFGAERAEMEGRYVDGHGVPWNLMAWTFCKTHETSPWQMKTETGLCQEAAEVMSCGGGIFLYNQPQRSGWLTSWHQDIFAGVARFCRERQPFCQHTRSVPEAVLLLSDAHMWRHNPMPFCMGEDYFGVEGALHALIENQIHTDVLDETRFLERLGRYKLAVVAEQDPVSRKVLRALEDFARKGGTVLLTGAHLADLCPGLAGVKAAGAARQEAWHVPAGDACVSLAGPWRPVRLSGATMVAPVMLNQQQGKDETEFSAVTTRRTGRGRIVAIHGDFMRNYLLCHHPRQRALVRAMLDSWRIPWLCRVDAPAQIEVAVRADKGRLLVNLVNRAANPTLTPRLHIVEDVPPTGQIKVDLRLKRRPKAVTLEPGARKLRWTYRDGHLKTTVASVDIHRILTVAL